jgi:hypothetical protein
MRKRTTEREGGIVTDDQRKNKTKNKLRICRRIKMSKEEENKKGTPRHEQFVFSIILQVE